MSTITPLPVWGLPNPSIDPDEWEDDE